jgi:uncharacterized protein
MIPVAWRRVDAVGFERGELADGLDGYRLRGTIGLTEGGDSFDASYEVACDSAWVTRSVVVELRGPKGEKRLRLAKRDGVWLFEDRAEEALRGCIDVDLAWTPSTNTLPIRRLSLAIGESQAVTAAWIRFPELTVEPLPQQYSRLDESRYRYSSAGGRFLAQLEVDEHGLVTSYGQIWTRV